MCYATHRRSTVRAVKFRLLQYIYGTACGVLQVVEYGGTEQGVGELTNHSIQTAYQSRSFTHPLQIQPFRVHRGVPFWIAEVSASVPAHAHAAMGLKINIILLNL